MAGDRPTKLASEDDRAAEVLRDQAEADGGDLTELLGAIPGAWDSAELGRAQGAAGQTTPLDQL